MAIVEQIVGHLQLRGGQQFSREIKTRLDAAKQRFSGLNATLAGIGAVSGFRVLNDAAIELEAAGRKLSAISRIMGVDLLELQDIAGGAAEKFKLSKAMATEFTIAITKLTSRAGETDKARLALERLLNVGVAMGLDTQKTLESINQAIVGLDEGTDKLFLRNPIDIYKEYGREIGKSVQAMSDQEKMQSILNAVMVAGSKVTGEYADFLKSARGEQGRMKIELREAAAAVGFLVQDMLRPAVKRITELAKWLSTTSDNTRAWVAALGAGAVVLKVFGGALSALLPALGPAGWIAIGLGAVISLFFAFRKEVQGSTAAIEGLADTSKRLQQAPLAEQLKKINDELKTLRSVDKFKGDDKQPLRSLRSRFNAETDLHREHLERIREVYGDNIPKRIEQLEQEKARIVAAIERQGKKKIAVEAAVDEKALAEQRKREENRLRFEFEVGEISAQQYLDYLARRKKDFEDWSNDWLSLHRELTDIEAEIAAQRGPSLAERLAAEIDAGVESIREAGERWAEEAQRANDLMMEKARQQKATLEEWTGVVTNSIMAAYQDARTSIGGFFKQIMTDILDHLAQKFFAARVAAILDNLIFGFNPAVAAKNLAGLAAGFAALQALRAKIGSGVTPTGGPDANGVRTNVRPGATAGAANANAQSPEPQIIIQAISPLSDRRSQINMAENVLRPALRRERARRGFALPVGGVA